MIHMESESAGKVQSSKIGDCGFLIDSSRM